MQSIGRSKYERLYTYWEHDKFNDILFKDLVLAATDENRLGELVAKVSDFGLNECVSPMDNIVLPLLWRHGFVEVVSQCLVSFRASDKLQNAVLVRIYVESLLGSGAYELALEELGQIESDLSDDFALISKARCHYELGQYSLACSALRAYLNLHPGEVSLRDRLSVYLWDADFDTEALQNASEVIAEIPNAYGSACVMLENLSQEISAYVESWNSETLQREPRVLGALANFRFYQSRFEEGLSLGSSLRGTPHFDVDVLLASVLCALCSGKAGIADNLVKEFSPSNADRAEYLAIASLVDFACNKKDEAIQQLSLALSLEPENPVAVMMNEVLSVAKERGVFDSQDLVQELRLLSRLN